MAYEYVDEQPKSGRYEFVDAPTSVKAGSAINSIPRQLGLTARYGLEGLANTAQIITEPLRYLTDSLTPGKANSLPLGVFATQLANKIGLPSPEGANERVIGDATRLGFGAIGGGGVAQKLGGAGSDALQFVGKNSEAIAQTVAQKFAQTMGVNPLQQVGSAAGAGLAGGASREAGGGELMQAGASVLGGIGGGVAAGISPALVGGMTSIGKSLLGANMTSQQLDAKISLILKNTGVDYSQVPEKIRQSMRAEMAGSLQADKEFSPEAVSRLLDFKRVGATPTRGMVSQDPIQITREMNLAKTGANSSDTALHGMAQLQNQNNTAVIRSLNNAGGSSEVTPLTAGTFVNGRIAGTNAALTQAEDDAWKLAKSLPGYKQPIFPDGLNAINKSLGEEGMMGFMPKEITDYMQAFQTGQQPFTPQAYRNLQSMLSGAMAQPGNSAGAAKIARQALESTPMRALTETGRDIGSAPVTMGMAAKLQSIDAQPQTAIDAVNRARAATAAKYNYQDKSSALVTTSLGGSRSADPEKIAQSFILNGTLNDAKSVAKEVGPEGIQQIRDALATHIKKAALSGGTDETGKVSQSQLNKVLRSIGDAKLSLFFSPDELEGLKATGRVANYMMNQPVGSAVNNSNSAAMMVGKGYDALKGGIGMLPGVGPVTAGLLDLTLGNPTKGAANWLGQRAAENAKAGLLLNQAEGSNLKNLLLPGIAMGGLLAAP